MFVKIKHHLALTKARKIESFPVIWGQLRIESLIPTRGIPLSQHNKETDREGPNPRLEYNANRVVNLSEETLSKDSIPVLYKAMNLAVDWNIQRRYHSREAEKIRHELCIIVQQARIPKNNITVRMIITTRFRLFLNPTSFKKLSKGPTSRMSARRGKL